MTLKEELAEIVRTAAPMYGGANQVLMKKVRLLVIVSPQFSEEEQDEAMEITRDRGVGCERIQIEGVTYIRINYDIYPDPCLD
jgi:hypothetical protein